MQLTFSSIIQSRNPVFSDWLLSLSNVHLKFINIFRVLVPFSSWIVFYYMNVLHLISMFTFFLAIMKPFGCHKHLRANFCVDITFQISWVLCFAAQETANCLLKLLLHFAFLVAVDENSCYSTSLRAINMRFFGL